MSEFDWVALKKALEDTAAERLFASGSLIDLAPAMADELLRMRAKLEAAEELAKAVYDMRLSPMGVSKEVADAFTAFRTAGESNG